MAEELFVRPFTGNWILERHDDELLELREYELELDLQLDDELELDLHELELEEDDIDII